MGFRNFRGKKDTNSTQNGRLDNRYPIETDVLIVYETFKGKFKSKDLSQTGFALKQNVPKELAGHEVDFAIIYTTSSGDPVQTQGTARLIDDSLNRFKIVSGEVENFFAKIWPKD